MHIRKSSLLSTTLLGLTVVSSAAFAGNCGSMKAYGAHGAGIGPMSNYRYAVQRFSGGYGGMPMMRTGHHMSGYSTPMAAPAQPDIVEIAASAGDVNTLVAAVTALAALEAASPQGDNCGIAGYPWLDADGQPVKG